MLPLQYFGGSKNVYGPNRDSASKKFRVQVSSRLAQKTHLNVQKLIKY